MAGASVRAQKAFALDYCAASFVTEGTDFCQIELLVALSLSRVS